MAVALNTTTYTIANGGLSKAAHYNTKELQFGDGYVEIDLDGINYQRESYSLSFIPLANATCETLLGILLNSVNGTSNVLSWQPPGDGSTKYWIARDINKQHVGNDLYQVSCTLVRQFIL